MTSDATSRAVQAFIAADPALRAPGELPGEREQLLRKITATPGGAPSRRRPRRWRSVALGVAALGLLGAGGVAAMTGSLPVGDDSVVKTADEATREAQGASPAIPVAPGERDPGAGPIGGQYAQGAAAGQLLIRRMCTWDKRLLGAIAAGDSETIASTKAELAPPLWYTYLAPPSADDLRRMHVEAGPGRVAKLQQFYDVNCRDIAP